ncbi:DUF2163 domain-containing protein [Qipengyuania sp. RANM35]|uniref:DUF2163 domain-containing protein n=1 Tax=Qipengyuania sp. RANM35 TaxID=3068635 RepID=UPI0034DB0481
MSRIFFERELDTAAAWWRIYRSDGVTLGFTTHDRDLLFDGVLHRAAPGMLPSAIRKTVGFTDDESEVEGAISHAAIREEDLVAGRYDGARVESGIVDWQSLETATLHGGSIGSVSQEGGKFAAQLRSAKADLDVDPVPLSSPTCRASFCGPECALNPLDHETRTTIWSVDPDANRITTEEADHSGYSFGTVTFLDGTMAGLSARIIATSQVGLNLDRPVDPALATGARVKLREGCDKTIATCAGRFDNACNFRGEPFLPGNDMLAQYPMPR